MKKSVKSSVVIGRDRFAKISAVEGIKPNRGLDEDFRKFDEQNLAPAERRKFIARKYGGKA